MINECVFNRQGNTDVHVLRRPPWYMRLESQLRKICSAQRVHLDAIYSWVAKICLKCLSIIKYPQEGAIYVNIQDNIRVEKSQSESLTTTNLDKATNIV